MTVEVFILLWGDGVMLQRLICKLANTLWIALCAQESNRFLQEIERAGAVQEKILLNLLEKNQTSSFGRRYNFKDIKSVKDYQRMVPLSSYNDYEPYMNRIAGGEQNVLTTEPVLMFELSSGSAAASKYIPYTQSLKSEFQCGLKVWMRDMFHAVKGLSWGSAYWSISPITAREKYTSGGVPVGFEEDNEYFGMIEQFLLKILFAVPAEVKHIDDIRAFRYVTLLFLLKSRHLAFLSVWNPTFLTLLFENLQDWIDMLVQDLEAGSLSPSLHLPDDLRATLDKRLGRHKRRAKELRKVLAAHRHAPDLLERIWPCLSLISCWTSSYAEAFVPDIQKLFPTVPIQGKGLLATEAFVSVPIFGHEGSLLSFRSHFFEFIEYGERDENTSPQVKTAAELIAGRQYEVVLTTGGGLYRYKLHDIIEVKGFRGACPIIEFMGKSGKVCDYFGEKVNEFHVSSLLSELFARLDIHPAFFMLAPEEDDFHHFRYTLYLDMQKEMPNANPVRELARALEEGLCSNYHYAYCRKLGQLHEARVFLVQHGTGAHTYLQTCRYYGQRAGDIKPVVLHTKTGWSTAFAGALAGEP